jgi:hypothetical protein
MATKAQRMQKVGKKVAKTTGQAAAIAVVAAAREVAARKRHS